MLSSQIGRYLYVFVVFFVMTLNVTAQTLTVPPNEPNTRFSSQDVFASEIVRPALSVRGFDSNSLPGGTNYGLGLKQILEGYLQTIPNASIEPVVNKIISEADMDLVTPTGSLDDKRKNLDTNSRITQSRAFVALATYILENNGYTPQQTESIFGESHSEALQELKDALLNPPGGNHMALDLVTDDNWTQSENTLNIAINMSDLDPVKLNKSLSNMARAIDLYLALENACTELPAMGWNSVTGILEPFNILLHL